MKNAITNKFTSINNRKQNKLEDHVFGNSRTMIQVTKMIVNDGIFPRQYELIKIIKNLFKKFWKIFIVADASLWFSTTSGDVY